MGPKTRRKKANAWGDLAVASFNAPGELLEAVLSSTGVGVAVFDRRLRYTAINKSLAAMNGVPPEAHLGKKLHEILGDVADKIGGAIEGVFKSGEPLLELEIVAELPGRKGVGCWVESYRPIKDGSRRVQQVAVIVVEVTERKKLESEVRRIDEKVRRASAELQEHQVTHPSSSRFTWNNPAIMARSIELAEDCVAEAKILSGLLRPVLRLGTASSGVSSREFLDLTAEASRGPEGGISAIENTLADRTPEELHLSPREQEVLKLMAEGNTNREIAAILGISPRTVEAHRARVMMKLDVHSSAELICYAIRHQIIKG